MEILEPVYTGSRIAVPRKHTPKWHFPKENATLYEVCKGMEILEPV